jgi:hypothetical protein
VDGDASAEKSALELQIFEKFNRPSASQQFRLKERRTFTCDWMNSHAADAVLINDHFGKEIMRPGGMISLGKDEIAQRKKNGLSAINLDGMRDMWMMANDAIGASVDQTMCNFDFAGMNVGLVLQTPMQRHNYRVCLLPGRLNVLNHELAVQRQEARVTFCE